ncbi:MAG: flagellar biosynthesis regulator FlaF [Micropepsaceae bacterium]
MSLQAYHKAQRSTERPRDTEYRLFAQVTQALIEAGRKGRADLTGLIDALDWNRRMWSVLASDCASNGNKLPDALRAQIVSLSLWVSRYSSEVARTGATLEPLIDINKTIMAGLSPQPVP